MMNRLLSEAIAERAISRGRTERIITDLATRGAISQQERDRLIGVLAGNNRAEDVFLRD
jgi:hypothetical protein